MVAVKPEAYDISAWKAPVYDFADAEAFTAAGFAQDGIYRIGLPGGQTLDVMAQGLDLLHLPETPRSLLIGFNAAVPARKGKKAPFFSGLNIAKKLQLPILSIADPSLALDDTLSLAWYAGNEAVPDLPARIARILNHAARQYAARLVLFGGSGGGFAALAQNQLASSETCTLVFNPQTSLGNYPVSAVAAYLRASFPEIYNSTVGNSPPDATNIKDCLTDTGIAHEIAADSIKTTTVYLQNHPDKHHLVSHTSPFMQTTTWQRTGNATFIDQNQNIIVHLGDWRRDEQLASGHITPEKDFLEDILSSLSQCVPLRTIAKMLDDGTVSTYSPPPYFSFLGNDSGISLKASANYHGSSLFVSCAPEITTRLNGVLFAFFLYADGKRIDVRRYQKESSTVFTVPQTGTDLEVIVQATDRLRNVIKTSIKISPMEQQKKMNKASFLSEALYQKYSESFLEHSIDKWTLSCKSPLTLKTPNGSFFTLSDTPLDWLQNFPSQTHSARMWLHSLGFLEVLLNEDIDKKIDIIRHVLTQYDLFLHNPEHKVFISRLASQDHCRAIRLRTLSHILLRLSHDGLLTPETENAALSIIDADCKWALEPHHLKLNNHGLLLAEAILHVRLAFDTPDQKLTSATAAKHIIAVLEDVVDKDGFVNENTVGYHEFYLKVLGEFRNFLQFRFTALGDHDDVSGVEDLVTSIFPKVENALYKTVWPNGGIPPLGDSGCYDTNYPSISGAHFFPESGLFVQKSNDFYFSLICGSGSETHKHVDDTSITLRYKGQDILIDAGIFHYDYNDPLRQCVQSQRGHSGLFFRSFDPFLRVLFKKETLSFTAGIRSFSQEDGITHLECGYDINGLKFANRAIHILSETEILIVDTWKTQDGEQPIRRFILPPEAGITIKGKDTFLSFGNGFKATVSSLTRASTSLKYGTSTPIPYGWRSTKFNHIEPTYCLELDHEGNTAQSFTLVSINKAAPSKTCLDFLKSRYSFSESV